MHVRLRMLLCATVLVLSSSNCIFAQGTPITADDYFTRGLGYLSESKDDLAIADFSRAIELNPVNLAQIYINRAAAYRSKGDLDSAIDDYAKVIELNDPDQVPLAYLGRSSCYYSKNAFDPAIEDLNKVIGAGAPESCLALSMRAQMYFAKKEYDKSWEDVHALETECGITQEMLASPLRGGFLPSPPQNFIEDLKLASGKDGGQEKGPSVFADAVVIQYTGDYQESIGQEYKYLEEKFGVRGKDWELSRQSLVPNAGRMYDKMVIELLPAKGATTVYFDITGPFEKMNQQLQ